MGKKVNQQLASAKMSKNEKQLHSLIKVLRPKVYITDSLSFKQLVQELTGYRTQTSAKPEETDKVVPVIELEDQGEITPAATATLSIDTSFYSFESSDHQAFDQLVEINELTGMMQTADDHSMSMFDQVYPSSMNEQTDWLAYQNLESWLLDGEPYYSQHEQEVSLFDYELSGLM